MYTFAWQKVNAMADVCIELGYVKLTTLFKCRREALFGF